MSHSSRVWVITNCVYYRLWWLVSTCGHKPVVFYHVSCVFCGLEWRTPIATAQTFEWAEELHTAHPDRDFGTNHRGFEYCTESFMLEVQTDTNITPQQQNWEICRWQVPQWLVRIDTSCRQRYSGTVVQFGPLCPLCWHLGEQVVRSCPACIQFESTHSIKSETMCCHF